jgi:hypothetical protein
MSGDTRPSGDARDLRAAAVGALAARLPAQRLPCLSLREPLPRRGSLEVGCRQRGGRPGQPQASLCLQSLPLPVVRPGSCGPARRRA